MPAFTGRLNANEIFASLYNMIISQEVFADNIKGAFESLADMSRVDGGLYGDTKLYYSADVLQSNAWGNDTEAANLLALDRPSAPDVQGITLNKFRQIRLTVDNYLSKRAWSTEGAFSSFNSVMLGMIRDTKKIYDATTFNAFIGTNETTTGSQDRTITAVTGQNPALTIAEDLARLLVDLQDVGRDYNDYGHMRSYDESDFVVIWNSDFYTSLKKVDMPVIFHNEGLLDEFEQKVLPARYFGTVNAAQTTANGTTHRSLIEQTIGTTHYFAGDLIATGATIPAGTSYTVDPTIAYKVMHKRSVPFMSAFEVGTSFFNPRSLTENHYLTWGHNTFEHLKNYPFITARYSTSSGSGSSSSGS